MSDQPLKALDPPGCSCTDCLTGYSLPLDQATPVQVWKARMGVLDDRTSGLPKLTEAEALAVRATLDLVRNEFRFEGMSALTGSVMHGVDVKFAAMTDDDSTWSIR